MINKLILIILVPMTLSLQADFIMTKGQALKKVEETITQPNSKPTKGTTTQPNSKPTKGPTTQSSAIKFTKKEIALGKNSVVAKLLPYAKRYKITGAPLVPNGWDTQQGAKQYYTGNKINAVSWVRQWELIKHAKDTWWIAANIDKGATLYKDRYNHPEFTKDGAKHGIFNDFNLDSNGNIVRADMKLDKAGAPVSGQAYRTEYYDYMHMKPGEMTMGLKIDKFVMSKISQHAIIMQVHNRGVAGGPPFAMIEVDYKKQKTRKVYMSLVHSPGAQNGNKSIRMEICDSSVLEAASPQNPVLAGIRIFKKDDGAWYIGVWVGGYMVEHPIPEYWAKPERNPYFKFGLYAGPTNFDKLEIGISDARVVKNFSKLMNGNPAWAVSNSKADWSDWN